MEPIRFFDSLEHLEPRCPQCKVVLKYGINTEFDDEKEAHRCKSCGALIE
ncbi:hypothetical protein KY329_00465 [Candidatus Woesearchaeota archaeon]|nr:hypothetical protein [Candidatus Woesearchaeota archaeon]